MEDKPKLRGTLINRKENLYHLYYCPAHSEVVLYKEDNKEKPISKPPKDIAKIVIPPPPKVCIKCKKEGKDVYSYYKHECKKNDKA